MGTVSESEGSTRMQINDMKNDALKIGELPHLHIVAIEDVILHEDPDIERVARLVERLSADGILKNPLVVASTNSDGRRIVLDGANRLTALIKLGLPHVLVQDINLNDEDLTIDCWHHAIEHMNKEEILAQVELTDGVEVVPERVVEDAQEGDVENGEAGGVEDGEKYGEKAGNALPPDFLCRVAFADGETIVLKGSETLLERIEQLQQFTHVYHKFAYLDRVSYTNLDDLRRNYRHFTALISFGRFSKDDLITLTNAEVRIPSGITRVLLPKRALRFNLQLEMLSASLSLEEKEEWLKESIREKINDKSIRFYREPTFFFDE